MQQGERDEKKKKKMTMTLWMYLVAAFDLACLSQQHKSHLGRSVEPSILCFKFGPFSYVYRQLELFLQTSTYGLVCVSLKDWYRLGRFKENIFNWFFFHPGQKRRMGLEGVTHGSQN